MFLFTSNKASTQILERNAGPCTYNCANGTVQKVERTSQAFLCGCIPTPEHTETVMECTKCRRVVRAAYYTGKSSNSSKGPIKTTAGYQEAAKTEIPMIAASKIDR